MDEHVAHPDEVEPPRAERQRLDPSLHDLYTEAPVLHRGPDALPPSIQVGAHELDPGRPASEAGGELDQVAAVPAPDIQQPVSRSEAESADDVEEHLG